MFRVTEESQNFRMAVVSLFTSAGIHFLFLLVAFLLVKISEENNPEPGYVTINTIKGISSKSREIKEAIETETKKEIKKNTLEKPEKISESNTDFLKIETSGFDTTNLVQIYQEKTLNVKMKYPVGWVYLDQQVKNKLDGITFWSVNSSFSPPPYIHIEVIDKYYFNPARYKYIYKFENFVGYYNDPEEMEEQVTQILYIRTEDDEDFSIKLIINGRENFKQFQPVFFAMIKSFSFGDYIF